MGIENLICFGHSFECMDPSISILRKKSRKGEEFEKNFEKKTRTITLPNVTVRTGGQSVIVRKGR